MRRMEAPLAQRVFTFRWEHGRRDGLATGESGPEVTETKRPPQPSATVARPQLL
jgi:hypothetical protein